VYTIVDIDLLHDKMYLVQNKHKNNKRLIISRKRNKSHDLITDTAIVITNF